MTVRNRRLGRGARALGLALAVGALAGCAGGDDGPSLPRLADLNPFAEKEVPLPGKRIAVLQKDDKVGDLASADQPIALPPAQQNDAWAQPGGTSTNAPGHLALGASLKSVWSASAGEGSNNRGRLTASPIVYDGRVYTLDAYGRVAAFSAGNGAQVWRVATAPKGAVEQEGFGGGLAADGGRLYAATGFGMLHALDPKTGKQLWEKSVGTPVRASPTAVGDRVFLVSSEGRFFCFSGADGTELWSFRGLPERASLLTNVSPAADSETVVVPYPSGDLIAIRVKDGQPVWSESLARTRGGSALASLSDAGRPVIDGGTVFAVGHAGRMIAVSQRTGERLWTLNVPSIQQPWVAGDTVYVVDTGGQLMAVARKDGKVRWTMRLPEAKTWSGPVLAGTRLWLTSSKGKLVGVDAATGKVAQQSDVGASYIAPVVAQGRLYVLTDAARLIALN